MSFGKQLPPNPTPGNRNDGPIRLSKPIPLRTRSTSALSSSQRFANSFMKEIFVARKALDAYLIISAVRMSVTSTGLPVRMKGAYSSFTIWAARFEDYRQLGEQWFAFRVALSFPRVGAKAQIDFKKVELNPELPSDVFVLSVPGGVQ